MNKRTLKVVFYHFKDNKNATRCFETDETLKEIFGDMRGNNAVLDAIYTKESEKVTLYSNNLTKSDIYANL